jgi:cell division protein FtsB
MEAAMKKASFLDTVKTVLAGAVGIRRKEDHERAPINPLHLVIAAVLFVLLFIFTLITIVKIVLS